MIVYGSAETGPVCFDRDKRQINEPERKKNTEVNRIQSEKLKGHPSSLGDPRESIPVPRCGQSEDSAADIIGGLISPTARYIIMGEVFGITKP